MIDKDIEILKALIGEYNTQVKEYKFYSVPVRIDENDIEAIENVLKDLEYNKKQFAVQLDEKITLKQELETYKKIAERIAKLTCRIANYDDAVLEQKVKEMIDWARKEVEKDV